MGMREIELSPYQDMYKWGIKAIGTRTIGIMSDDQKSPKANSSIQAIFNSILNPLKKNNLERFCK